MERNPITLKTRKYLLPNHVSENHIFKLMLFKVLRIRYNYKIESILALHVREV